MPCFYNLKEAKILLVHPKWKIFFGALSNILLFFNNGPHIHSYHSSNFPIAIVVIANLFALFWHWFCKCVLDFFFIASFIDVFLALKDYSYRQEKQERAKNIDISITIEITTKNESKN